MPPWCLPPLTLGPLPSPRLPPRHSCSGDDSPWEPETSTAGSSLLEAPLCLMREPQSTSSGRRGPAGSETPRPQPATLPSPSPLAGGHVPPPSPKDSPPRGFSSPTWPLSHRQHPHSLPLPAPGGLRPLLKCRPSPYAKPVSPVPGHPRAQNLPHPEGTGRKGWVWEIRRWDVCPKETP